MGKKKSSFHMGDEFNGNGQKVYLRPTQHRTYTPLSQQGVRLKPDFSQFVPKAIGAIPVGCKSANVDSKTALKALGGIPSVSQVMIKKEKKTGTYKGEFRVRKKQLTTGGSLHSKERVYFKDRTTVVERMRKFEGRGFLVAVEREIPYIYSSLEFNPLAEIQCPEWRGDFDSEMDLTFGIGHSIKTKEEFDYIKSKVEEYRDDTEKMVNFINSLYIKDLERFVDRVNNFCASEGHLQSQQIYLTQNQFDAIVLLLYNCDFRLTGSTLGNELEAHRGEENPEYDKDSIIEGFKYTIFNGTRNTGLVTRRNNELNLFFNNDYNYYDTKEKVMQQGIAYIEYP